MKKVAVIKILDEINVAVIGLTPKEYEHFYDKFGIYDKGYIFKPNYNMGRWDGKIRLFTKAGKTSIHFMAEIIPDLRAMGYKITVKDNRNPITFDVPPITHDTFKENCNIVLANHQVDSVNNLIENRGGIAIIGTGGGKSYICGALISQLYTYMKARCLVIVPTADLVIQTAAEIELFGVDVGMYGAGKKQLNKKHLVSTWQSLQNNQKILGMFDAIIVDEAHGAKSNVLKGMLGEYGSNAMFISGVTGTLPKHEAELRQVNYVLGYTVIKVEGKALIDLNWLAKLNLTAIELKEDFKPIYEEWKVTCDDPDIVKATTYKKFKANYFPDYAAEKAWIKTNKKRNNFLSGFINDVTNSSGNSFVLVNGVDFGKRLAKQIPGAIYVQGTDDSDVRKKIYDLFSTNNNIVVIATFSLASTGLNIKRIFNLFLLDANKSFIQVIQSIGRGLRKADDKNSVNVWDIHSDTKYSKRHSNERKKYYKEQKYTFKEKVIDYHEYLYGDIIEKEIDKPDGIAVY